MTSVDENAGWPFGVDARPRKAPRLDDGRDEPYGAGEGDGIDALIRGATAALGENADKRRGAPGHHRTPSLDAVADRAKIFVSSRE